MDDLPEYIDHEKAIHILCENHGLEEKLIRRIVENFFTDSGGTQKLIRQQVNFVLPGIGAIKRNELGEKLKKEKIDRDAKTMRKFRRSKKC